MDVDDNGNEREWSDQVDIQIALDEREQREFDKEEEEKQKLAEDIRTLRTAYSEETDIRVKTSLRKYIDLLRNAQKYNEKNKLPRWYDRNDKASTKSKKKWLK